MITIFLNKSKLIEKKNQFLDSINRISHPKPGSFDACYVLSFKGLFGMRVQYKEFKDYYCRTLRFIFQIHLKRILEIYYPSFEMF